MIRVFLLNLLTLTPALAQPTPWMLHHGSETVSRYMTMDSGSVCDQESVRAGDKVLS
jgi:hypothetical protein